ncbi:SanA/YdcF family protein [Roseibacillus ishigakijimensis]|uniref:YdcF family protein n=1 Tax=Roseibacillus ishigakijimensis TaxID=454146 RepID=A0A934RL12_9BACT|nr:ElyC/SanA/YdcF family protein [Roseibacillus ishigakijimensis]MBK1832793.1 YdcF family protein [Roseibacillus ishigakijimensis]
MKSGGSRWWRWVGLAARFALLGMVLAGAFVLYTNLAAKRAGEGLLFDRVEDVPPQPVGLLFGTTDKIGEEDNLYFVHRIDAAVELWEAGKVECLLVSGDNRERFYNEPNMMRDALLARGVPKEVIVRDFAGLRTLDTVVRAKKVFRAPSVVLISQQFHNERAAYIARSEGLSYVGYNARDLKAEAGWKTRLREVGARVKMWLDVRILDTGPRHLGEWEYLPIEGHPLAASGKSAPNSSLPSRDKGGAPRPESGGAD